MKDITELLAVLFEQYPALRKEHEELLYIKDIFYSLLEHTPDFIYIKDTKHRFLYTSNALARLVQYNSWRDLRGKTDLDIFPKEHAEAYFEKERNVISKGEEVTNLEEPYYNLDGKLCWVSSSKRPLYNRQGDIVGLFGISRDITAIKQLIERIEKIALHVTGFIYQYQAWPNGHSAFPYASAGIRQIYGVKPEDVAYNASAVFQVIHPDDLQQVNQSIAQSAKTLSLWHDTYRVNLPDGKSLWVEGEASPERQPDGSILWHGYIHDITERIQALEALQRAEEQARLLLKYSYEGIFGLDNEGITTFVNPAALKMLGHTESDLIGKKNHALIHHAIEDGTPIDFHDCRMMMKSRKGAYYHADDEVFWRKDGTCFPVEYKSTPIFRDGEVAGSVVTFHDISERRESEAKIVEMAFRDALTGLPNRRSFTDALDKAIVNYQRYHQRFAVLLLDLDHFKEINDTKGHPVGDALLKLIATRLRKNTRESDFVARLGGDEFIVLMPTIQDESEPATLCHHLLEALGEPSIIKHQEIVIAATIGIWCSDGSATSGSEILSSCDIALYQAKEAGRGGFLFFQTEMNERVVNEARIAQRLSQAIANEEFRLVLQPVVSILDGKISGFEALLRWRSPILGDVSPVNFIPIAEKRGLIKKIGIWVIDRLCELVNDIEGKGIDLKKVGFNVSRAQLRDSDHVRAILDIIIASNIDLSQFVIEITETGLASMQENVMNSIEELRKSGLTLAIDDFGTGYSSLVALRNFRASHLKIDYQFIQDMLQDEDDRIIVEATINLAHSLKMNVVAEGVETPEQYEALKTMGCGMVQGYYISKPLEVEELSGFYQLN